MPWELWNLDTIPEHTLEWIEKYPKTVVFFIKDALQKVKELEAEIRELKEGV